MNKVYTSLVSELLNDYKVSSSLVNEWMHDLGVHKTSIWIIEEGWTKEWLNMDEWMNKCILCSLV